MNTIIAVWLSISAGSVPTEEVKLFSIGGEQVRLTISPDEIFVRPGAGKLTIEKPEAVRGLVETGIQAQVQAKATAAGWAELAQQEGQRLVVAPSANFSGGVFIRRAPNLDTTEIQGLFDNDQGNAQPVFLYESRRVLTVGTVSVRFREAPPAELLTAIQERFGLQQVGKLKFGDHLYRFAQKDNGADPITTSEFLAGHPLVAWAEPDLLAEVQQCSPMPAPTDTFHSKQWYLKNLQMEDAWQKHNGGTPVIVAVLDDGVDLNHPDLKAVLVPGFDFVDQDDQPQPTGKAAHGTACAGIIAAAHNQIGIAGIAPGTKIMPIRIANESGFVSSTVIADAIEFAGSKGAKLLICSWGGGPPSNLVIDAIDYVTDNGALVFAAAGNARPQRAVFFPARYERCIAVGSLRQTDSLFDYSCFGPGEEVDLTAPSGDVNLKGDIWSTDISGAAGYNPGGVSSEEASGDYTGRFGGTSAATPVAVGVAAWLWSSAPTLTNEQVRNILEQSAKKVDLTFANYNATSGRSKFYGFGK